MQLFATRKSNGFNLNIPLRNILSFRGSKYLDYETWKVFLEELAYCKRLTFETIQGKLLAAGKPAQNQISVMKAQIQKEVKKLYYHPKTPSEAVAIADKHHHPA